MHVPKVVLTVYFQRLTDRYVVIKITNSTAYTPGQVLKESEITYLIERGMTVHVVRQPDK